MRILLCLLKANSRYTSKYLKIPNSGQKEMRQENCKKVEVAFIYKLVENVNYTLVGVSADGGVLSFGFTYSSY